MYWELNIINNNIRKNNKAINNAKEFGVVEVEQIINCWILENKLVASKLLWKLCEI